MMDALSSSRRQVIELRQQLTDNTPTSYQQAFAFSDQEQKAYVRVLNGTCDPSVSRTFMSTQIMQRVSADDHDTGCKKRCSIKTISRYCNTLMKHY